MAASIYGLQLETAEGEAKRGRGRPRLAPEVIQARNEERTRTRDRRAEQEALAATANPVEQARMAFGRGNRLSAAVGLVLGGFVPLASYTLVHLEVSRRPLLWVLVVGGLVYSAFSVYGWARKAFRHRAKALGFVVLLEGTLTFCSVPWLSLAGLAILMVLNGVTAAVALQEPGEEEGRE